MGAIVPPIVSAIEKVGTELARLTAAQTTDLRLDLERFAARHLDGDAAMHKDLTERIERSAAYYRHSVRGIITPIMLELIMHNVVDKDAVARVRQAVETELAPRERG